MEEPSSSQTQNSIKLEATDDPLNFDKDTKPFPVSTSPLNPSLSQQKQSLDNSQPTTASTQSVLLNSFCSTNNLIGLIEGQIDNCISKDSFLKK